MKIFCLMYNKEKDTDVTVFCSVCPDGCVACDHKKKLPEKKDEE